MERGRLIGSADAAGMLLQALGASPRWRYDPAV
jgi:hypothetical protein